MYETDSDSEAVNPGRETNAYSQVVKELKSALEVESDSAKNEDQTKGVLKNYPSVGSLTKKKVLFNLKPDDRKGGSTTSVASSVLDGSLKEKGNKKRDVEDLSDFDFSLC